MIVPISRVCVASAPAASASATAAPGSASACSRGRSPCRAVRPRAARRARRGEARRGESALETRRGESSTGRVEPRRERARRVAESEAGAAVYAVWLRVTSASGSTRPYALKWMLCSVQQFKCTKSSPNVRTVYAEHVPNQRSSYGAKDVVPQLAPPLPWHLGALFDLARRRDKPRHEPAQKPSST